MAAVIILPEISGPDDALAQTVASWGYMVVSPLLGDRRTWPRLVHEAWRGRGRSIAEAQEVVDWVRQQGFERVGVIGTSWGAALALHLDGLVEAISFNYGLVSPHGLCEDGTALIASFGGRDRLLPSADRPLRQLLAKRQRDAEIVVYPEARHSFLTRGPASPARVDALERTKAHLARHLAPKASSIPAGLTPS